MLRVEFSRNASKYLESLSQGLGVRLLNAIENLHDQPFPHGVKRVENQWFEGEKVFRIRVGNHRILYCINHDKKRLMIVNVDKRARVYD